MSNNIFISKNSFEPYQKILPSISYEKDLNITLKDGFVTGKVSNLLFLVVIRGTSYSRIKLFVNPTSVSGILLQISKADTLGNPIGWTNEIIYDDLEFSNQSDLVVPFVYKWIVLDNIYKITAQDCHSIFDIFVEE